MLRVPGRAPFIRWPFLGALLGLPTVVVAIVDEPLAVATSTEAAGTVHALTSRDFDERVKHGFEAPWLIKFYAPWCSHCKALEPAWKQLAKRLQGAAYVAKVDCIAERWLSDQFDVESFPTIKLIADGHLYTYNGPRNPEALQIFATTAWRLLEKEMLPKDKPWQERFMKVVTTYSMHISVVMIVGMFVWLCCGGRPTEEQIAKRKAFEEKLKEFERLADEKIKQQKEAEARKKIETKREEGSDSGRKDDAGGGSAPSGTSEGFRKVQIQQVSGSEDEEEEADTSGESTAKKVDYGAPTFLEGDDPDAGAKAAAEAKAPKTASEKKCD